MQVIVISAYPRMTSAGGGRDHPLASDTATVRVVRSSDARPVVRSKRAGVVAERPGQRRRPGWQRAIECG
jgi:hypothetical protein